MQKEDEPNFYEMDKVNPLPSIEESGRPELMSRRDFDTGYRTCSTQRSPAGFESDQGGTSTFELNDHILSILAQQQAAQTPPSSNNVTGSTSGAGLSQPGTLGTMGGMQMMNTLESMNGICFMGGLGYMSGMNQMNTMNGMSSLRDSSGFENCGNDFGFQKPQVGAMPQMQRCDRQLSGMSGVGGKSIGTNTPHMNLNLNWQQR